MRAKWGFSVFGGQYSEPKENVVILQRDPSTVAIFINFPKVKHKLNKFN